MKWYHFSVEYFEDLRNINHCEFLIMAKQESGKYVLENKLRTWSELRRERAKKEKEKDKDKDKAGTGTPTIKDANKLDKALISSQSPIVAPRRWGGCPNGCSHDKSFRIRSALAELVKRDGTSVHPNLSAAPSPVSAVPNSANSVSSSLHTHGIATPPTTNGTSTPSSSLGVRRQIARRFQSEDEEDSSSCCSENDEEADSKTRTPQIDVTKAREEAVSSPDGTPSFISVDDRLRAQDMKSPPAHLLCARGRDFGGSYSGHNSDADSSEDERTLLQRRRQLPQAFGKQQQQQQQQEHQQEQEQQQQQQLQLPQEQEEEQQDPPAAGKLKIVTSKVETVHIDVDSDGLDTGDGNTKNRDRDQKGMGRYTMANRLGDSPVSSSESGCFEHHADDEREKGARGDDNDEADDLFDIDEAEREDRSIKGSVY